MLSFYVSRDISSRNMVPSEQLFMPSRSRRYSKKWMSLSHHLHLVSPAWLMFHRQFPRRYTPAWQWHGGTRGGFPCQFEAPPLPHLPLPIRRNKVVKINHIQLLFESPKCIFLLHYPNKYSWCHHCRDMELNLGAQGFLNSSLSDGVNTTTQIPS